MSTKYSHRMVIGMIAILFFIFPFASGATTYYQTGGNIQSTYEGDDSNFNNSVTVDTSGSRALSTRHNYSLFHVGDIDNDTIKELVIIDGNSIEIYENKTLGIDEVISTNDLFGDIQLHDIDGDNILDIVYYDNDRVEYESWNGTEFINNIITSSNYEGDTGFPNHQSAIKCNGDECGLVVVQCDDTGAPSVYSKVCDSWFWLFNATNVSNKYTIYDDTNKGDLTGGCIQLPPTQSFAVDDIDSDTVDEFVVIVNYLAGAGETDDAIYIYAFEDTYDNLTAYASNTLTIDDTWNPDLTFDVGDFGVENVASCSSTTASSVTAEVLEIEEGHNIRTSAPLIMNINPGTSDLEVVFGMAVNENAGTDEHDFKLITLDSSLTFIDDHPEAKYGAPLYGAIEGSTISTPTKARCFEGSSDDDFMAIVFNTTESSDTDEQIICGSNVNTFGTNSLETITFNIDSTPFDLSYGGEYTLHSLQVDGDLEEEVLTPYGVIDLSYTGVFCNSLGICSSSFAYTQNDERCILQPLDYEESGKADILGICPNQLKYYDDSFTNENAQIDGYDIDPCLESSTVKQNETVTIKITPLDANNDDVQARAILYFGDSNAQDSGWSAEFPSGTQIDLPDTIVNKTGDDYTLRLIVRDVETLDNTTRDINFTVSVNGVESGDCQSTQTGLVSSEVTTEEEANLTTTDLNTNSVRTFTSQFSDLTGFGEGLIALLIILFSIFGIWYSAHLYNISGLPLLGVMIIVYFTELIIFVKIGLLSTAMFISNMVIALIVLALLIYNLVIKRGVS